MAVARGQIDEAERLLHILDALIGEDGSINQPYFRAEIAAAQGQDAKALQLIDSVLAAGLDDEVIRTRLLLLRVRLFLRTGAEPHEARILEDLERARAVIETLPLKHLSWYLPAFKADLAAALGRLEEALQLRLEALALCEAMDLKGHAAQLAALIEQSQKGGRI